MLIHRFRTHWSVMELLLTLQNYPLPPCSYLVKSVTAWWKFDLRFVFGCRGIQGRTPGKWVGERWCLYYFCLPLLLPLPLLRPTSFFFFFSKAATGRSFPNYIGQMYCILKNLLENFLGSPAISVPLGNLSPLFLVILLPGGSSWCLTVWCGDGPHSWLPWEGSQPM